MKLNQMARDTSGEKAKTGRTGRIRARGRRTKPSRIKARRSGRRGIHVQRVKLNGKLYRRRWVPPHTSARFRAAIEARRAVKAAKGRLPATRVEVSGEARKGAKWGKGKYTVAVYKNGKRIARKGPFTLRNNARRWGLYKYPKFPVITVAA